MTKRYYLALCITCVFITFKSLAGDKAEAQVHVRVRGEDNQCISGAVVRLTAYSHSIAGEAFGKDVNAVSKGTTDTNGVVALTARSIVGQMRVGLVSPVPGFYPVFDHVIVFTNTSGGKWQPWNQTIDIQLNKVQRPVALFALKFGGGILKKIPQRAADVGLDLLKGDWVAPYGNGLSTDLVFRLDGKLDGLNEDRYQMHDSTLTIKFSNEGDGIQSSFASSMQANGMRLKHLAPLDGYESNLVKHAYRNKGSSGGDYREDQNYFFRIRTKKDEKGEVIGSLYGKIHGDIGWDWEGKMCFTYYVNPSPNDRNLEFDPKQNLFKNLPTPMRVFEP